MSCISLARLFAFPARQSGVSSGAWPAHLKFADIVHCLRPIELRRDGEACYRYQTRLRDRTDGSQRCQSHRCQSTLSVILVPPAGLRGQGRPNRHLAAGSGQLAANQKISWRKMARPRPLAHDGELGRWILTWQMWTGTSARRRSSSVTPIANAERGRWHW